MIVQECLTLFRMGLFVAAHGWGDQKGLSHISYNKICHTYPTMMKLGEVIPFLRNTQKRYESCDIPLEFC